jgi:hypothetical protein
MRQVLRAQAGLVLALLASVAGGLDLQDVDQFTLPTNAVIMVYSPTAGALVLKNSGSAVAVVDIASRGSTLRLANWRFTDIALAPSGRYVFAADYGGENIGYGTPANTSYVHRIDLSNGTWDLRTAYIAGHVQAVSDTQLILKSLDQWVTFTNNEWGSGAALVPLNASSGYWGPGYYAVVYRGDFRYDRRTSRLLHGNSGSSSQEIQAFRLVDNQFITQEGSGVYGSATGHGGSVALATDGSAFYYGRLQDDPLDVAHNRRVFPEPIYAANGRIALGNGNYFDPLTGALLGSLPFQTIVYAMNPQGDDFWAYDAATTTAHHFVLGPLPTPSPTITPTPLSPTSTPTSIPPTPTQTVGPGSALPTVPALSVPMLALLAVVLAAVALAVISRR